MKQSTECLEAPQVDSLLQGNLTPEEYEGAEPFGTVRTMSDSRRSDDRT
jgi:hypothetical protein